jgi:hypothetical protein
MRRYHDQELLQDIADGVGVCPDTIAAIIRRWHREQGVPAPDGRARRKQLPVKASRRDASPDEPF